MTDTDITLRELDQLKERIRIKKNAEMAAIRRAAPQLGFDPESILSTLQGSLLASTRKIDRVKQLLETAP